MSNNHVLIPFLTFIDTTDQWAAQVDIWGTEGILRLDLELMSLVDHNRDTLRPWRVAGSGLSQSLQIVRDTVQAGAQVLLNRYQKTHDILIEQFVDSILHDTPAPVTAEEGREAVRVMGLIVEALEGQRENSGTHRRVVANSFT